MVDGKPGGIISLDWKTELGGIAPEAFRGTLSAFNPSPAGHYRAMISLLAAMDFKDLAIGAAVGAVIAYLAGGAASSKEALNIRLLALQVRELQQKLDALLKYHGVELPPPPASGFSPELERLASLPDTKIAAIQLY